MFGHPLICTCGYVKLWEGVVRSSGNSQHLTDWYTFSHIIHGFLFYFFAWIAFPRYPAAFRFLMALGVEVSWEIIENTPMVIQHYRQQALAQGYTGDSVINSLSDSIAMMLGFWSAWQFPAKVVIVIALVLEVWVGYEIRDDLTLNVINLIYAFPAIQSWQAGAGL
ncbi:hypothetical protein AQUSIP_07970 [Aquicella siphonis]|uniref:Uncharacterized protein n=2 Tax=Aquicella siphonis TaxID=254247 RepID=A0A5E4PGD2_9COXI|nr:hypothetical protein AQUSIP_07970 [Aquicella siphonis]